MKFLATTRLEKLLSQQRGRPILMVDGTVPNWSPSTTDLHFDHHRPGGAKTQIEEMIHFPFGDHHYHQDRLIVTTMVDADACAAAAFYITRPVITQDDIKRLKAIAYDCDHLYVPDSLSKYANFAANAVAAMKLSGDDLVAELNLNPDRKMWSIDEKEEFASLVFERGTMALVDAINGYKQCPGANGEADEYWREVNETANMFRIQNRVTLYRGCAVINCCELGTQYVDPRAPLAVIRHLPTETPITLTQRERYAEGKLLGYSYTLGCIPWDERCDGLDYTREVYKRLTIAESKKRSLDVGQSIGDNWGNPNLSSMIGFDPWGGRATVGGSGWNTPSILSPEEVIDVVLDCL